MSPDLLVALNPEQNFATAGVRIVVANVSTSNLPKKVARMEVDKSGQALRTFAADGNLLAYYPATVGSREKPAPGGTLKVTGVRKNPTYRYNPDYAFKAFEAQSHSQSNLAPTIRWAWSGSVYLPKVMGSTVLPSRQKSAKPNRMVASD
jgi:lipoprotein-anchoring transpeptidase ErfK/SrfK